ncbi:MAG: hemin uptake protein HemP [Burkholderiaceae bacterium]
MDKEKQADSAVASASSLVSAVADALPSQQLFRGRREVVIRHAGEDYRLRITRLNKLILTK